MASDIPISAQDAREAERNALRDRLSFGPRLRLDESKLATTNRAMAEKVLRFSRLRSPEFDSLLSDPQVNKLFASDVLYFERS